MFRFYVAATLYCLNQELKRSLNLELKNQILSEAKQVKQMSKTL